MTNTTDQAPFNLDALRSRIEAVLVSLAADLDHRPLAPDALVQLHLARNALEKASIHVYAAGLVPPREAP